MCRQNEVIHARMHRAGKSQFIVEVIIIVIIIRSLSIYYLKTEVEQTLDKKNLGIL